ERRMYLPLAAIVVMGVLLAHHTLRRINLRQNTRWSIAALLIVCAWLTAGTLQRNGEYSSAMTMAEVTLARRPHARTHAFLGEQLVEAGRREEAIEEFRAGAAGYPLSRFALGQELFVDRQLDEAIVQLRQFVAEAPTL